MRFLLTNDDGIDAPGLQALCDAAGELGEVAIVAPERPHSGCGHQVTTHGPIQVRRLATHRLAVTGTPADCVRLALHSLVPDFDWVLSGINAGGNLGADVYHSGTVAAVREAVLRGRPGIAFSHYLKRDLPVDWTRAGRWARQVLEELIAQPWTSGCYWNVNFPHLPAGSDEPALATCQLERAPLPLGYRQESDVLVYSGNYHQRQRQAGSDVDVCFGGQIAVCLVREW